MSAFVALEVLVGHLRWCRPALYPINRYGLSKTKMLRQPVTTVVNLSGSKVTTVLIITLVIISTIVTSEPLKVTKVTGPQINERKKGT